MARASGHRELIVTADDLGASARCNDGIMKAFSAGIVTHASAMANMPEFDDACARAREAEFASRVGVHLVLTQGEPLTDAMRGLAPFCGADGNFVRWTRGVRTLWLTRSVARVVLDEWRAQIARCRAAGLDPQHIDSHHHVHAVFGSLPLLVIRLAREEGIPRVRLARVPRPRDSHATRVKRAAVNRLIRSRGLAGSERFGSLGDWERFLSAHDPAEPTPHFEVMVHPVTRPDGLLVDDQYQSRPLQPLRRPGAPGV